MKYLNKIPVIKHRFLFFFKDPEGPFGGGPEWAPDPEKQKKLALTKLYNIRGLSKNENLTLCLQSMELFIRDELDYEVTDTPGLKDVFIERLCALDIPPLTSEILRSFSYLNTREDFDLATATPDSYFSGFLICWIEIIQRLD